jgi:hypothetical protein
MRRFMRFGSAGSPDIVCVIGGQYIGIEVKRKGGKQSEAQKEFQASLETAGGEYCLYHRWTRFTSQCGKRKSGLGFLWPFPRFFRHWSGFHLTDEPLFVYHFMSDRRNVLDGPVQAGGTCGNRVTVVGSGWLMSCDFDRHLCLLLDGTGRNNITCAESLDISNPRAACRRSPFSVCSGFPHFQSLGDPSTTASSWFSTNGSRPA